MEVIKEVTYDTETGSIKIRKSLERRNNTFMNVLYGRRGLFYAFLVALSWCSSDVCTKILSNSLHPMEIACIRQCALTLTVTPLVINNNAFMKDSRAHWRLLVLRGFSGALNALFRTIACNFMSIGNVSAVTNTMPVFAAILGWVVLRERLLIKEGLMSLVAITGVVLIAQPSFLFKITNSTGDDNFIGVIFALGEAFTSAFSIVMLRRLGGIGVDIATPIAYYAVFGLIIDALLTTIWNTWTLPPCLPQRLLLLAFSPLVMGAQLFLAEASRLEKALNVSLVSLTTICISLFLQWFIFKTLPNWLSAVGMLLVLTSAVTLTILKSSKLTSNSQPEKDDLSEEERIEGEKEGDGTGEMKKEIRQKEL